MDPIAELKNEIVQSQKKLHDDMSVAWAEFKQENDKQLGKKIRDVLAEAKLDKLNEAIGEKDSKIAELSDKVEKLTVAMNRPGSPTDEADKKERLQKYNRYLSKWLRKGDNVHFTQEERDLMMQECKALSVDDDAAGGYLVHPQRESQMIRDITVFSPVRELVGSNVMQISTDAVEFPRRTQGTVATRAGERQSRSESQNPALANSRYEAPDMYVEITSSQKLLDDSPIDIEAWLQSEAAEAFALKEGTEYITGTGGNMARGVTTYTNGTGSGQVEQVVTGSASLVIAAGIVDIAHALKDAYLRNATWLFNRTVLASIRKLVDGNGAYIWLPGLQAGMPGTIYGRPYRECPDLSDEGAGNLVGVLADWSRFYLIVDRLGTRILRDPFSSKPNVVFNYTRRTGGGVFVHEAGKILKCSA